MQESNQFDAFDLALDEYRLVGYTLLLSISDWTILRHHWGGAGPATLPGRSAGHTALSSIGHTTLSSAGHTMTPPLA